MRVSSSPGSAAPGHTTAFRGSSNEDVRQRDAVINYECRTRCKVVLEEFKRMGDPLQPESAQLLTPIPGDCGLDYIFEDMVKKSYLDKPPSRRGRRRRTQWARSLTFREVDPLVDEGSFLDATTQEPRLGHK